MRRQKPWFTLIEIIIALMVFSVGVVVLLQAIIYFLGAWSDANSRAQATLLAKEGMELVFTQRDTNLLRWVRWDCASIKKQSSIILWATATDDACAETMSTGKTYIIDSLMSWGYTLHSIVNTGDIALYRSEQQGTLFWHHDTQQTPTYFTRSIQFFPANASGSTLPQWQALLVRVRVGYLPGDNSRAITLESYIAAWEKTE
jgi:type II secretory pathway pseudopilin PulG